MSDTSARVDDATDISDEQLREYYQRAADVWAAMSAFDIGDETVESLIVPGTISDSTVSSPMSNADIVAQTSVARW